MRTTPAYERSSLQNVGRHKIKPSRNQPTLAAARCNDLAQIGLMLSQVETRGLSGDPHPAIAVPAVLAGAGEQAARRFLPFFAAPIRNGNTRMA